VIFLKGFMTSVRRFMRDFINLITKFVELMINEEDICFSMGNEVFLIGKVVMSEIIPLIIIKWREILLISLYFFDTGIKR